MKTETQQPLFKISLLSISALLTSAAVISPALPDMIESFPDQSQSAVETVLTIPNFGIILALLVSPLLIRFIGKKKTVLTGLAIALISGLLPLLIGNYLILLISRFMFGFGIGLFNSLAVSLIAEFYQGDELATMMGFQSMAGAIGGGILAFVVSYLVTLGWQQTFWAYFIVLPVMLLFGFFVPISDAKDSESSVVQEEKFSINLPVAGLAFLIFALFAFFMVSVIKLPELIIQNNIGNASTASQIAAVSTLISIPIGMFYGKINQRLGNLTLPIGLLTTALGFFVVAQSSSLTILFSGVLLYGIGFGLTVPFTYTWTANVSDPRSINFSYTVLIITTNMGVFFSPLLVNTLGGLISGQTSAEISFLIAAVGFIIMSVIMGLKLIFNKKEETN